MKDAYEDKIVKFSYNHNQITEKENRQLFLAMTGTKQFIIDRLIQMLNECQDSYGKPRQGKMMHGSGSIDIVTPIWNGETY